MDPELCNTILCTTCDQNILVLIKLQRTTVEQDTHCRQNGSYLFMYGFHDFIPIMAKFRMI